MFIFIVGRKQTHVRVVESSMVSLPRERVDPCGDRVGQTLSLSCCLCSNLRKVFGMLSPTRAGTMKGVRPFHMPAEPSARSAAQPQLWPGPSGRPLPSSTWIDQLNFLFSFILIYLNLHIHGCTWLIATVSGSAAWTVSCSAGCHHRTQASPVMA